MTHVIEAFESQTRQPSSAQRMIAAAGPAGLYLLSFAAVLSISVAQIGIALMIVSLLAQWRSALHTAQRDLLVWLALAWPLYLVASIMVGLNIFPPTMEHQLDQALDWARLSLVMVVAWHFRGDVRRFTIAASLFALGATVRILMHAPWGNLAPFLAGQVPGGKTLGFGLSPIAFSSYLAVMLLWLTVFAPRIWRQLPSPGARIVFSVVAAPVGVLALEGVIIGSSRGTWLASLVAFAVLVVRWKPWMYATRRTCWIAAITTALTVTVIVAAHGANILRRATIDQDVYEQIVEGDLEATERKLTSTGIRVQMWVHGAKKWLERPLLGWGVGSEQVLLQQLKPVADLIASEKVRVPHSHNLLIELLMRFGIGGAVLFLAFPALIFWRLRSLHRAGKLDHDVYSFFLALFVLVTVWSMFDMRIMWDYRHFVLVFFGMAASLAWKSIRPLGDMTIGGDYSTMTTSSNQRFRPST